MKFKIGDRVKIPKKKSAGTIYTYDEFVEEMKNKSITCDYMTITYINSDNNILLYAGDDIKIRACCFGEDDLELYKKTFDDLEVGDIVQRKFDKGFNKILGRCGDILFMTYLNSNLEECRKNNQYGFTLHMSCLTDDFIIYQEENKEVTELTMDEIASKFNIPVSQLKIKK